MKKVVLSEGEIEVLKYVVETFAKASLEAAEDLLEATRDEGNEGVVAALADADAMRILHEKLSAAEDDSRIILQ
jgi:hypothetical protein